MTKIPAKYRLWIYIVATTLLLLSFATILIRPEYFKDFAAGIATIIGAFATLLAARNVSDV